MNPACEVCGLPAVVRITDTKVIGSFTDEDGEPCALRAPESTHLFCTAHRREPIRHPPAGVTAEMFTRLQTAALKTTKG